MIDGEKTLIVEHQGQEQRIAFDQLLCAVGRSARRYLSAVALGCRLLCTL